MIKFNILKWLYKRAPMNFYSFLEDATVIKSINNTCLGYKFDRVFTEEEINSVWNNIKKHKRFSTIMIFLSFIVVLYGIIFPNYNFLSSVEWYCSILPFLVILWLIYKSITFITTKCFEKSLKANYGEYEATIFSFSENINEKYYNLFKIELLKVFLFIVIILLCFGMGSPFKIASKCIQQKKYDDAVRITTIGSKIFPIAPEWYSLRAYSRFKLKDYGGAIRDYDRAYKLEPDEYSVMNFDNKIFIKYYIGDYKGALKDFDKEIKNSKNDEDRDSFYWDKAQFLYNIKNYKAALKIYDYLIEKADSDRVFLLKNRLYFERAQVYERLGQDDLAQQDYADADDLSIEESFKNPIPKPVLLFDGM